MEYSRKCPKCQGCILYNSKYAMQNAEIDMRKCKKCAASIRDYSFAKTDKFRNNIRDKINIRYALGWSVPFKGKHHSSETIEILKKADRSYTKTEEFRKTMSAATTGIKNAMYGKSIYDCWLKKYGIEEADKKMIEYKKKMSLATKGKKNPMYNKPSPNESGHGWKGYYKNIFFRSLRELSYMIYLIKNNISFVSAEHLKIKYIDYKNSERTYRPDFILLDERKIIEIKPLKLIQSPTNILKHLALQEWCKHNNYICEIYDVVVDTENIKRLWLNNEIEFLPKYEEKIKTYFGH